MKILRTLLTGLVVLGTLGVSILFALQNKSPVPLDILVYTFTPQSLAVWVLAAFALGGLMGMLVSSFILVRTRTSLVACKRQLNKTRDEANKLRSEKPATDTL